MNVQTPPSARQPRLPEELLCSSTFLLKKLGFAVKERSTAAYDQTGLNPYHHAILAVLDEGTRETQGAIADALDYDRGQLVGLLDELEQQGFVERRRDPSDRRRHTVRLTPTGREQLAHLRALARELEDDFLAVLDPSERAQLQTLLRALAAQHLPNCEISAFAALPQVPTS